MDYIISILSCRQIDNISHAIFQPDFVNTNRKAKLAKLSQKYCLIF